MGRSKKQSTELELLQQENKELRSINKSLKRQLKDESKKYKPEYDQEELIEQDHKPKDNTCPDCKKGKITKTPLGPNRTLIACSNSCVKGKIVKNGEEKKEDNDTEEKEENL